MEAAGNSCSVGARVTPQKRWEAALPSRGRRETLRTSEHDARAEFTGRRWLLVNIAACASESSALAAWRRLRALGAHYMQPSVCLLPERPETTLGIERIMAHVERAGGHARVF